MCTCPSAGVALILRDLREAGYVASRREGRRVFYSVVPEKPMRTDNVRHRTVGELLRLLLEGEGEEAEQGDSGSPR